MVRRAAWKAGIALAALLSACEAKPEQPDPKDILAARQAALKFETKMQTDILQRLARDEDPVAVYLAYADNVPAWGKDISDAAQLDFSRTSLTARNAANAPDDWETKKMETFNFLYETGVDPSTFEAAEIVQEGDEKVFRWIRPIAMTEPCLTCHGERNKLDPRIKLLLLQEYPLDEAVDYIEGALGGAFSVRKVLTVNGKPPPPYTPKPLPPRLPADARQPGDAPLVQPRPVDQPAPYRSPYDTPPPDETPPN